MFLKFALFSFFLIVSLFGETLSYNEILKSLQSEQKIAAEEVFHSLGVKTNHIFTSLQGGMTRARLYTFSLNDQRYVLRFLDHKHPQIQRQNEIQACRIAYDLGIGPNCLASDRNALVMVMPFIEGHPLTNSDLNENTIDRLGKMLHTLHTFSETYPMKYSLLERLQMHYQKGKKSGIAYPSQFDQSIAKVLSNPSTASTVPCHGDLNPSNILIQNAEIFIIDWANATMDDPFIDLSFISLLTNMTEDQEKAFLKVYFGRDATSQELEKLEESQGLIYLLTAAIWFRFSESDEDKQLPYTERVAKIDTQLHDPSLKSAQEYLNERKVVNLLTASPSDIKSYALSFYKAYLSLND